MSERQAPEYTKCKSCNRPLKEDDIINCWVCQEWEGCETCWNHHERTWCPTKKGRGTVFN